MATEQQLASDLYSRLAESGTTLHTLVSTKIYPEYVETHGTALPFVTYSILPTQYLHTMTSTLDLRACQIQVDAYSDGFGEASQIADAIETRLARWSSTRVQDTLLQTRYSLFQADDRAHRITLEFQVWWE